MHSDKYPVEALYAFQTNALVDEHNNKILQTACGENLLCAIPAEDSVHGQPFRTHQQQCRHNDTGGLLHML